MFLPCPKKASSSRSISFSDPTKGGNAPTKSNKTKSTLALGTALTVRRPLQDTPNGSAATSPSTTNDKATYSANKSKTVTASSNEKIFFFQPAAARLAGDAACARGARIFVEACTSKGPIEISLSCGARSVPECYTGM